MRSVVEFRSGGVICRPLSRRREQVVGDYAFEGIAVQEAQADPETVEFGAAEEGFALGLVVVGELADEIDGANLGQRDGLMLAVGGEQVDGVGMAQVRRIEVAAQGFPVG